MRRVRTESVLAPYRGGAGPKALMHQSDQTSCAATTRGGDTRRSAASARSGSRRRRQLRRHRESPVHRGLHTQRHDSFRIQSSRRVDPEDAPLHTTYRVQPKRVPARDPKKPRIRRCRPRRDRGDGWRDKPAHASGRDQLLVQGRPGRLHGEPNGSLLRSPDAAASRLDSDDCWQ